jgi:hypothetical protein
LFSNGRWSVEHSRQLLRMLRIAGMLVKWWARKGGV